MDLAQAIATAAIEKKAFDLVLFDVRGKVPYADFLVVCSGRSDRQVKSIAEGVGRAMRALDKPIHLNGMEGARVGRWVLMDYDDLILHVFHEDARGFYDLDRLWHDAIRLDPETMKPTEAPPVLASSMR